MNAACKVYAFFPKKADIIYIFADGRYVPDVKPEEIQIEIFFARRFFI